MKLLGRGQDPDFWVGLKNKKEFSRYVEELNSYWEKVGKNIELKALLYSKWKLFWSTGNRELYQDDYFERRELIEHALPLALIYPEREEYVEKLTDAIFAVCDEYTWCLPAHQGQNDTVDETRIDLFAAETGFYLSLIYALIGERLDPIIRERIRAELDRRIFSTFLSCENYGWWEKGKTNWTAVCVGSVGCAMMLMRPELVTEGVERRLLTAMQGFLDGFADDGICTEGCGYWAYGVSFFVQFADMIKNFTNGRIDYFKDEKVKAIATFPQRMFLSEQASVSFADGPTSLDYSIGVLHRLKSEYPEDVLIYSPDYGTFDIGCGRLCIRLYGAIWLNEEYYNNPADSTTNFEAYAGNAEWLTKRTDKYGFAAKAGHNEEMHNHNDVGSFIFAKDGRQLIMDIGAGVYTRQYFGKERYDILEPSSRSHNLPIIDGEYQFASRLAAASEVEYREGRFQMDIAGAYRTDKARSIKRSFDMDDVGVTLTDTFEVEDGTKVVERFVSSIEPRVVSEKEIYVGDARLTAEGDCEMRIGGETSESGVYFYFIDFKLSPKERVFTLRME